MDHTTETVSALHFLVDCWLECGPRSGIRERTSAKNRHVHSDIRDSSSDASLVSVWGFQMSKFSINKCVRFTFSDRNIADKEGLVIVIADEAPFDKGAPRTDLEIHGTNDPKETKDCPLPVRISKSGHLTPFTLWFLNGASGAIRTRDHPLRRRMLYPTELRTPESPDSAPLGRHLGTQYTKSGSGNRENKSFPETPPIRWDAGHSQGGARL